MEKKDTFSELIRAAGGGAQSHYGAGSVSGEGGRESGSVAGERCHESAAVTSVTVSHHDDATGSPTGYRYPTLPDDFERRVMIEVARRAIARSRRRARLGLVASLSGVAMLLAGCIVVVVVWFPLLVPSLTQLSWLEYLPSFDKLWGALAISPQSVESAAGGLPFFSQWGGLVVASLAVGSVAGFIYCLNRLFNSELPPER